MSSFEVYLLLVAIPALSILFIFSGLCGLLFTIMHIGGNSSDKASNNEIICMIISLLVLVLCFFVPSRSEMITIYIAPKIANSQIIQQIPSEIMKFIDKQIASDDK